MKIVRNAELEQHLLSMLVDSYDWDVLPEHVLPAEPKRGDEIHLSDLLSPLQSFWKRKLPQPVSTTEAQLFMYGRGFEVEMVRRSGLIAGESKYKHGVSYRPDFAVWPGVFTGPIELKWRRANLADEGAEAEEYINYTPQIRGYCAFDGVAEAKLIVNTPRQGQSGGDHYASTQPATRVYDLSFDDGELRAWEDELVRRAELFAALLAGKGHIRSLPLCDDWKCGSLKRTKAAYCLECNKDLVGQWEHKHVNTKVGAGHTVTPPDFAYEARCPWYVFCRPQDVDSSRGVRMAKAA